MRLWIKIAGPSEESRMRAAMISIGIAKIESTRTEMLMSRRRLENERLQQSRIEDAT
jgi:hypothetical protein